MRMKLFKIIYIVSSVLMSGLSIGVIALAQSTSATYEQDYCEEPGFEPSYRTIQCSKPTPAEVPLSSPVATPEIDFSKMPIDAGGRDYQPPRLPSVGGSGR